MYAYSNLYLEQTVTIKAKRSFAVYSVIEHNIMWLLCFISLFWPHIFGNQTMINILYEWVIY